MMPVDVFNRALSIVKKNYKDKRYLRILSFFHSSPPSSPTMSYNIITTMRVALCLLVPFLPLLHAFVLPKSSISTSQDTLTRKKGIFINDRPQKPSLHMIDKKRKAQLGIGDDEDEYDLYRALDVNTDKGEEDVCYLVYISFFSLMEHAYLTSYISYLYLTI